MRSREVTAIMAWEKQGMVCMCVCVGDSRQKWDFDRVSNEFASPDEPRATSRPGERHCWCGQSCNGKLKRCSAYVIPSDRSLRQHRIRRP